MTPHRFLAVAILSLSLVAPLAMSQELLQGEHAEHDKKTPAKKAEPKVSPEAKTLLDQVTAAYKKLDALNVSGALTAEIDAAGEASTEKSSFNAFFLAPNKFKHEIKDAAGQLDLVLGSTGEKLYAFRPNRNDYKQANAPKERVAFDRIPNPMRDLLQMQNPSLMSAVCEDAGKFLVDGTTDVTQAADTTIDGVKHPTLAFKSDQGDYQIALNPHTHLMRRIVFDMRKQFAKDRDDVKKFVLTYDYTSSAPVAPAEQAFAWAAPDGAREAVAAAPDLGENAEKALLGKDAPAFSLKDMKGNSVGLADFKGSVVILDFWATWCGPCRAALPGLNKLHNELKDQGLHTFAIDLEESKDVVQPVAAKLCPDLTVLFDEDSSVAKQYGVSGIPQTVVIGKDGRIRKVIIGGGNEAKIKAAAEAALKE